MAPIREFEEILKEMRELHARKNTDYADPDHQFENFERQAQIQSWYRDDINKAFAGLIGLKLARLATLLNRDDPPMNESIDDSFTDLATYAVLWAARYRKVNELEYPESRTPVTKTRSKQ